MTISKRKIYFIIGPTSSGKTSLSIELAKKLKNAEIISADSRQVYRDLDISSGKVTEQEMENIPHHLLDVVNPGEYFSVVDFTKLALEKIEEIFQRKNIPIICGGTGFYIDSLLYDYNLPNAPINKNLRKSLETKNPKELFKILEENFLNNFSKKIKFFLFGNKTLEKYKSKEFKNNKHRMIRAIEIVNFFGYLPEIQKVKRFPEDKYDVEIISTNFERKNLREKIYKRLIERIDAGMIAEIKNVKEKYDLSFKYLESLGLELKWVAKFLQKEISKDEMVENLNSEIYQYSKRQETWFKRYKNYR